MPVNKFRGVEFVDDYLGHEKANIVGLSLSAAVPVASPLVERLDIVPLAEPGSDDGGLELGHYQYLGKSGTTLPKKLPTLLTEIVGFLDNSEVSDNLAFILITGLIEKWTQYVKI